MTKILVVDDEEDIRGLLVEDLTDNGFDVVSADNGASALGQIYRERPDIVLLDLMMPVVDGYEVLRKLRDDPSMQNRPVVLITAVSPDEGEQVTVQLGANHYLSKPWEPGSHQTVIRGALREGERSGAAYTAASSFLSTGNRLLDIQLGGGVPISGLTLIEEGTSTGNSVLCQHVAYAGFNNGFGVAYFTTQYAPRPLIGQIGSLGLDPSLPYRSWIFRIEQLPEYNTADDTADLLALLFDQIVALPSQFRYVIVDAVTSLVDTADEREVQAFFTQCKKLGDESKSIFLSADPIGLTEDTLFRVRAKSDGYLALRLEKIGARLASVLKVCKVGSAEE